MTARGTLLPQSESSLWKVKAPCRLTRLRASAAGAFCLQRVA